MKNTKNFGSAPALRVSTQPSLLPLGTTHADDGTASRMVDSVDISLPENPSTHRTLLLSEWLGRGMDKWVWATASQLRALLASEAVTASTVVGYWRGGMRHFFEFIETHGPHQPDRLKPEHIEHYIDWLAAQGWAYTSQKNTYSSTKSVLLALVSRRVIPASPGLAGLFPANPYPGSNSRTKGATPLSFGERIRLGEALRDDIIAIHRGEFQGAQSQALVVYALAIAIRCGCNPTPLLEAERDCVSDHPFLPTMKTLRLFKRRGNATQIANLRYSREEDDAISIPMDGVAVLTKALALSAPHVARAKPQHRNRLWLYEPERGSNAGEVTVLTGASLALGIQALMDRHKLLGDDGQPLSVTLSRLRKTVEMRLFDLSGGDLIATAALMGHDPKVADTHYLACTQQMREDAAFLGEVLPELHRSGQAGFIPIKRLDKTPSGLCKDSLFGDKAPKTGGDDYCGEFLSCFSCRSYAITGHPDDLLRLFQTYNFLGLEVENASSDTWRVHYRNTMNLIDRFALDKFGADAVAQAKARAKAQPSKFWSSYSLPRGLGHA
jgi:hypothetical protein